MGACNSRVSKSKKTTKNTNKKGQMTEFTQEFNFIQENYCGNINH